MYEEIQKKLVAMELIQELIVDILESSDIIKRTEFENELQKRVDQYNKEVDEYNSEQDMDTFSNFFGSPIGEA